MMLRQGLHICCFLVAISLLGTLVACTAGKAIPTDMAEPVSSERLDWETDPGRILMQPAAFYGSDEAIRITETVLLHQSNNSGWPQTYPLDLSGYSKYITFNDDAMIGVMTVLRDVAKGDEAYAFVDKERRQQAAAAVEKGIACILQCQIVRLVRGGQADGHPGRGGRR